MQTEFFLATIFNLIMNLVYTIIALFIGIFALKIIVTEHHKPCT